MFEKIIVPAKINLSLAVTGKRENLHTLDMQAVSVNVFDRIEYRKTEAGGVKTEIICTLDGFVEERFRPLIDNAIALFERKYGEVNAELRLEKSVPLGKGMGGSTASAVAVVLALAKIKNVRLDNEFLLSVGSDAPYMAKGGYARISGVGETVEDLGKCDLHFVVVYSKGGVDSKDAYALYDRYGAGRYGKRRNDLERAARMLNSGIATARRLLNHAGATDVVMTGSGSAVVGIFGDVKSALAVYNNLPEGTSACVFRSLDADEIRRNALC